MGKGLDAYVAVDASGTFSETKRQVGLLRMLQAGAIVSDYTTLMVEILEDNARPEAPEVRGSSFWFLKKVMASVSATCSSFEMAEFLACTSISIPTIREKTKPGLEGGKNRHW